MSAGRYQSSMPAEVVADIAASEVQVFTILDTKMATTNA